MSDEFKVTLPKLGESIVSATVVRWFKNPGDQVRLDEPLLEVSTDKINSEIPSPVAGIVSSLVAQVDQEVQVGELLAVIATAVSKAEPSAQVASISSPAPSAAPSGESNDFISPAVLRQAKESGVSIEELTKIPGTGEGGRVTKKDLENYAAKHTAPKAPCPLAQSKTESTSEVERLKMSSLRKAIADNMVRSFYEAPHATVVGEVDVTDVLKVIQREKEKFLAQYGVKLTITSFVARAIVRALSEFPLLNSSLENDTILVKKYVNLGIAVSVDQGVMVPVMKSCQKLSFPDLTKAIAELAQKAKNHTLVPADVQDGTITLTNFGMAGALIGIPIIRFPEVAIVGVGAIHKKVVALEDELFGVRSMLHISLTFDHRVLDGMYGCGFLAALKKHLEEDTSLS